MSGPRGAAVAEHRAGGRRTQPGRQVPSSRPDLAGSPTRAPPERPAHPGCSPARAARPTKEGARAGEPAGRAGMSADSGCQPLRPAPQLGLGPGLSQPVARAGTALAPERPLDPLPLTRQRPYEVSARPRPDARSATPCRSFASRSQQRSRLPTAGLLSGRALSARARAARSAGRSPLRGSAGSARAPRWGSGLGGTARRPRTSAPRASRRPRLR